MTLFKYSRFAITTTFIIIVVVFFFRCTSGGNPNNTALHTPPGFEDFAGAGSCISCHKTIYEKHLATGHFHSSEPSAEKNIAGSFLKDKNRFAFSPLSYVAMEKRMDSFFQVEYVMGQEKRKSRFDITVGSAKKGQSYLSWKNNSLIQMPVTYFTPESTWSSSPGFSPQKITFNRVVTSRCLECHSTYFKLSSAEGKHPEEFDRAKIMYAVDCEKCHGPAKEHVNFHTKNPEEKEAKYIVNTGTMSRQAQIDLCALCHSGKLQKTAPAFSFRAGNNLSDFFIKPPADSFASVTGMDVHGNQLGMLAKSKCFAASEMTCNSCHDAHKKEEGLVKVFSERCMNCHNENKSKTCSLVKSQGNIIKENCIDCHMPKQSSQSIAVYLEGASIPTPAKLRTHLVTVYNSETEKVLSYLKNISQSTKQ
ncbi:MAG: multiheme c-type cytochrome [Ferruginibacter sp.]